MFKTMTTVLALALVLATASRTWADGQSEAAGIIDKAIKATGGADKLAKYKAATWKAKGTFYGDGGGGVPYEGEWAIQWYGKYRMEIKDQFVIVLNGDQGWFKIGDNVMDLTKEQLAEQQEEHFAGYVTTLLPINDKAFTLTLLGDTRVKDQPAVGVKVMHKGRRDVLLFFAKDSGLLIKNEIQVKDEQSGKLVKQETFYGDYKDFNGVKIHTKLTILRDGKQFVEGESYDIKPAEKLDDKMFAKP